MFNGFKPIAPNIPVFVSTGGDLNANVLALARGAHFGVFYGNDQQTFVHENGQAMTENVEEFLGAYDSVTRSIRVTVAPIFLDDQSSPEDSYYVWAYRVMIENEGSEVVQLKTRHWRITDAQGRTQEVRGDGVVGEQPVLEPGESFEYTSGTPLTTSSGMMMGSYQMMNATGEMFDVDIPAFSLDSPHTDHQVH